jgi:hypothetical protein
MTRATTGNELETILAMRKGGATYAEIGEAVGKSKGTIQKIVKRHQATVAGGATTPEALTRKLLRRIDKTADTMKGRDAVAALRAIDPKRRKVGRKWKGISGEVVTHDGIDLSEWYRQFDGRLTYPYPPRPWDGYPEKLFCDRCHVSGLKFPGLCDPCLPMWLEASRGRCREKGIPETRLPKGGPLMSWGLGGPARSVNDEEPDPPAVIERDRRDWGIDLSVIRIPFRWPAAPTYSIPTICDGCGFTDPSVTEMCCLACRSTRGAPPWLIKEEEK